MGQATFVDTPEPANAITEQSTSDSAGSSTIYSSWYPWQGRFTYNDGNAIGTYLHFYINEKTGSVTDYTVKFTFYSTTYYKPLSNIAQTTRDASSDDSSSTQAVDSDIENPVAPSETYDTVYKNKTIFSSIKIVNFEPLGVPHAYGDLLAFQGQNMLLLFYDQQGGYTHFVSSDEDVKLIFEVADDFKITQSKYDVAYRESPTLSSSEEPELTTDAAQNIWQNVWIKSDNTVTTLSIQNGVVQISGQTISITLRESSTLDISSWVEYPAPEPVKDFWYNDLDIQVEKDVIEEAKNSGIIPAEAWCTTETVQDSGVDEGAQPAAVSVDSDYYTYNDPTFTMDITPVNTNKIDVVVSSEIPTGRIVIINIEKDVLQANSLEELLVSIDAAKINKVATIDELMLKVDNKDSDGAYYVIEGEQIFTTLVYTPHFSTHTISIESLSASLLSISTIILPLFLSATFICLAIVGLVARRKRQQDDF